MTKNSVSNLLVIAHRAAPQPHAVPNSLAAIERCLEMNMRAIEIDVTEDEHGVLRLSHDPIASDSASILDSLESALAMVPESTRMQLDLKVVSAEQLGAFLRRHKRESLVISSFEPAVLRELAKSFPDYDYRLNIGPQQFLTVFKLGSKDLSFVQSVSISSWIWFAILLIPGHIQTRAVYSVGSQLKISLMSWLGFSACYTQKIPLTSGND